MKCLDIEGAVVDRCHDSRTDRSLTDDNGFVEWDEFAVYKSESDGAVAEFSPENPFQHKILTMGHGSSILFNQPKKTVGSSETILAEDPNDAVDDFDDEDEATTDDYTEEEWEFRGVVEENGIQYNRYEFDQEKVNGGLEDAEDEAMLADSGLLPNRFEYLEEMDGTPYIVRQYSDAEGENELYGDVEFDFVEPLNDEESNESSEDIVD